MMKGKIKVHPFLTVYASLPLVTLLSMLVFPGRVVVTAILGASTVAWWTVVAWYQLRSKWFKNPYGQNAMGVSFGLAVMHTVFLMGMIFGQYPGYLIVYTMAFLNICVLAVQRIRFIEKAQKEN